MAKKKVVSLTEADLARIESQASYTRTKADIVALVAEVRRLRAELEAGLFAQPTHSSDETTSVR